MRFRNKRQAAVWLIPASVILLGGATHIVAQQPRTSDAIAGALDKLCEEEHRPTGSNLHTQIMSALDTLKQMPAREVIAAAARALTEDERFRAGLQRRTLYEILNRLEVQDDGQALALFMTGLVEEGRGVAMSSANAIAKASEPAREQAADLLIAEWNRTDFKPPSRPGVWRDARYRYQTLLNSIAVLGPSARGFVERAVRVFCCEELVFESGVVRLRDVLPFPKSALNVGEGRTSRSSVAFHLRAAALGVVYGVEGIEGVIRLAERDDLDEDAHHMIMGGFAGWGARTRGTYNTDDAHRQRIRQLVLNGMTSGFKNVRKAALQASVRSFGENWVTIRSRSDYEMNPELKAALERMATTAPEEDLRRRAASALSQMQSQLDRAVEKILRKRRESEEAKATE